MKLTRNMVAFTGNMKKKHRKAATYYIYIQKPKYWLPSKTSGPVCVWYSVCVMGLLPHLCLMDAGSWTWRWGCWRWWNWQGCGFESVSTWCANYWGHCSPPPDCPSGPGDRAINIYVFYGLSKTVSYTGVLLMMTMGSWNEFTVFIFVPRAVICSFFNLLVVCEKLIHLLSLLLSLGHCNLTIHVSVFPVRML